MIFDTRYQFLQEKLLFLILKNVVRMRILLYHIGSPKIKLKLIYVVPHI